MPEEVDTYKMYQDQQEQPKEPTALSEQLAQEIEDATAPESEKALQARIAALEAQLAAHRGAEAEEPTKEPQEGSLEIYFAEDGFTAFGRVWYRGQEVIVPPDEIEQNKWLELLGNENEQIRKYGKVFFREGRWPGEPWESVEGGEAEASRDRRIPVGTRE